MNKPVKKSMGTFLYEWSGDVLGGNTIAFW